VVFLLVLELPQLHAVVQHTFWFLIIKSVTDVGFKVLSYANRSLNRRIAGICLFECNHLNHETPMGKTLYRGECSRNPVLVILSSLMPSCKA
jgi:hypothetical protein